jgi:hypothetical protein
VPLLGLKGAAIGTAITSMGWFAAQMRASQHHYPVPHHWRSLTAALALAGGVVALAVALLPTGDVPVSAGDLALRGVFIVTGAALASLLALGRQDAGTLLTGASRLLRRPTGQRQQPA